MENLRHRNRGVLSDIFEGSSLACQKTPGDTFDGTIPRHGCPKNPFDAVIKFKEYHPIESTCFWELRLVAGTRSMSKLLC